jgi:hypothetical protein
MEFDLRAIARLYQHDNHAPGDEGYCEASQATWSLEVVQPERFSNFGGADGARAWLEGEIAMDEEEGLGREWRALVDEEIRDEVVLLGRRDKLYIWDGWHRVAASISRGIAVKAIVGRPI